MYLLIVVLDILRDNHEKKVTYILFLIVNIFFFIGCNHQVNMQDIEKIENDCKKNIFNEIFFAFASVKQPNILVVEEIKEGQSVKKYSALSVNGRYMINSFDANGTYILREDNNRSYRLTEIKGRFNSRCHMSGCQSACTIKSYKIDNQLKFGMNIYVEEYD